MKVTSKSEKNGPKLSWVSEGESSTFTQGFWMMKDLRALNASLVGISETQNLTMDECILKSHDVFTPRVLVGFAMM